MYKNFILPAGLLAETIIGAGMFALPYVFQKSGIGLGLFYLFFFGLVSILIHLMYADIILRTSENHRFAGYARIYFGDIGFWSGMLMTILGAIFSLTVYLILSISFINLILPGASDIHKLLIFWFFGSAAIFLGINKLAISELLIFLGTALIVLIVFLFGAENLGKIFTAPLFNFNNAFLPYGVILFSLAGRVAIPALLGYFRNNSLSPLLAKKSIIVGSVAPAAVFTLFIFGILGLSKIVSEDSISGLLGQTPLLIIGVLGVLGIISLWSTYIVIGRDIKKSLEHDLNFPHILSGLVAAFSPLILYFLGFQNFLEMVALTGGVFVGLEGILVILMWQKSFKAAPAVGFLRKINPVIVYFLILVFISGLIYNLVY